jgi:hypothetical protein
LLFSKIIHTFSQNKDMSTREEVDLKRRTVKDNPFINGNINNSNYWLGFFAADGFINSTKIGITLKYSDINHLYKFKDFIGYDIPVKRKVSKDSYERCETYFRSPLIVKYLINLGITPRKSITLDYKGEFTNDFLRGVIDGDGCIRERIKSRGNELIISSGSEIFANQLRDYIIKQFNVYCSIRVDNRSHRKSPLYDVCVSGGTYDVLSIYENADTYLTRKYLTATSIRNNRKKTP